MAFDPKAAAHYIAEAHRKHEVFRNLPETLAPTTVADAYAAQEALAELWTASKGPVAGLKIATTTKVMQQLMGIDHPCGGMIYERTIHRSPAEIRKSEFMNVVVECELAVQLKDDLVRGVAPLTRDNVRAAVGKVMPAFELIEDRKAVYKESRALTLIADNAWNAGIVLGEAISVEPGRELNGILGSLAIDGKPHQSGRTDDPMGALAWVANLACERSRPLKQGMVVITGSVIATLPIDVGQNFEFDLEGIGSVTMTAVA